MKTYLLIIAPESRVSSCDTCRTRIATRRLILRTGKPAGLYCSSCGREAWRAQKETERKEKRPHHG